MLGWFKKKFGKKPEEPVVGEPAESGSAAGEPVIVEAAIPPPPVAAVEVVEPAPELVEAAEPTVVEAEPAIFEAIEPEPVASEPTPEEVVADHALTEAEPAAEPFASEPAVESVPSLGPADVPAAAAPEAAIESVDSEPEPVTGPEAVEALAPSASELPAVEPLVEEPAPTTEFEPEQSAAEEQWDESGEVAEEPEEERASVAAVLDRASSRTQEKPATKSMFQRLQDRLGKTRDALVYRLDRLFLGKKEIDQDLFEQLEEILITADLGVATTLDLLDRARKKVKRDQLSDPQALKAILRVEILAYIEDSDQPAELVMPEEGPFVIMVVGVNGVGKTTTIGKIAAKFVRSGQSVLLVAADTFRAAAINQLRIWGERVGVEVIAQKPGADPSSVVFDGLEYGVAHGREVIIIDTAGRLHTSVNLMEELKKIRRVIAKKMPGAPHEVLLVLDATTGQNGIAQAKMFHEAVGVSGLALTKLDGTAKGGIVANVCREIRIPVRFIGIGEQVDDLRDFNAREFVNALFARQGE